MPVALGTAVRRFWRSMLVSRTGRAFGAYAQNRKKCEAINAHVKNGTTPDPIEWSESTCGRCQFAHICLPEAKREALDLTNDPDLEVKLKRRAELAPLRAEYEELDDDVKAILKERPKVLCGDFLILGKWIEPKGRPKYWKTNIEQITPQKGIPA